MEPASEPLKGVSQHRVVMPTRRVSDSVDVEYSLSLHF